MARIASRERILVQMAPLLFVFLLATLISGCSPRGENQQIPIPASRQPVLGRFRVSPADAAPVGPPGGLCETLNNTFMQDMCYKDKVLQSRLSLFGFRKVILAHFFPEPYVDGGCYHVRDPYLQYMCFRPNFRPHMLSFMSGLDSYPPGDVQVHRGECVGLDEYHALFCTYVHAAQMARYDLGESTRVCALLDDDRAAGECLNYVASAMAMDIKTDPEQKISLLKGVCGQIASPPWRSECYYILADELALLRPVTHLRDIADACQASYDASNYDCFNHILWLLPDETREEFCSIVGEPHTDFCYEGIGQSRGYEYIIDQESTDVCEEIPPESRGACLMGWARSIGQAFAGRDAASVNDGIKRCGEFPPAVEHHCLSTLSEFTGTMFAGDVSTGREKCYEIPANYQEYTEECLRELAEAAGSFSELDAGGYWHIGEGLGRCDELPEAFMETPVRELCLEKLIDTITIRSANNQSAGAEACERFPPGLRERCSVAANSTDASWELLEARKTAQG